MALTRSLSNGASSLKAHQQRFDVISNNIANANTIGYKTARTTFSEQFNQVVNFGKSPNAVDGTGSGGINPTQYGLGVKMGSITLDMSQGVLETTGRALDLALQGDGYFVLNQNGRELYSRAGAFTTDREGYMVDSATGAFVQGYNPETNANGKILKDTLGNNILNRKIETIQIPADTVSPPKQSQNITVNGNLNSLASVGDERKTSIDIYNPNGGVHSLGLTFTKTANANEYSIAATIDGNSVNLASSTITFNSDGTLNTPLTIGITAADLNTALGAQLFDQTTPQDLTMKLADADNLLSGLTQFAMPNSATVSGQDGYESGSMIGMTVDTEGKIWGAFTNGQSEILGQLVMAKFTNQGALVKEGDNFFSTSVNSGLANIGTAGEIFPSTKIIGGSLEQSNVDMTQQFTDIISTQRAFEAASRTITISDQMLAEVNQLKR